MEFEDFIDFENKDNTFALRVEDDGMIEAGILSNDLIVVRKQAMAKDDEIVVAMVTKKKAILRYLRRKGRQYFLDSANPKYPPIRVDEGVSIIGKVVRVVRQFNNK